ncbi:MAG: hypothetical protein P1U39_07655 [Legionellaceae bacterium]|nr:hypothetical protein [Legionellaceae bacterium]
MNHSLSNECDDGVTPHAHQCFALKKKRSPFVVFGEPTACYGYMEVHIPIQFFSEGVYGQNIPGITSFFFAIFFKACAASFGLMSLFRGTSSPGSGGLRIKCSVSIRLHMVIGFKRK